MKLDCQYSLKFPEGMEMVLYPLFQAGWFDLMDCLDLSHRMEESNMKMMDCVEVMVEKKSYAREGVHKGMQGWICLEDNSNGTWLVNFPQCGEKEDIAEISIKEEDLKVIPVMNAIVNEQIKAKYDAEESSGKSVDKDDDLSGYLI